MKSCKTSLPERNPKRPISGTEQENKMSKCIRIPTKGPLTGLEPTDYIPPSELVSGDPKEQGKSYYVDQTGDLDASVWECEPNKHRVPDAPYDELVYLIESVIDVHDDEGGVETYKAGDCFMMPRGCNCTWDVQERVKKVYLVLTHSAYEG